MGRQCNTLSECAGWGRPAATLHPLLHVLRSAPSLPSLSLNTCMPLQHRDIVYQIILTAGTPVNADFRL